MRIADGGWRSFPVIAGATLASIGKSEIRNPKSEIA
jgi:hypothetical protein